MRDRVRRGMQNAVQLAQLVGRQTFAFGSFAVISGFDVRSLGMTLGIAMGFAALAVATAMATAVTATVATAVPATIAIAVAGKGRLLKIERCQANRRDRGDHEGGQKSTNGWAHCCRSWQLLGVMSDYQRRHEPCLTEDGEGIVRFS